MQSCVGRFDDLVHTLKINLKNNEIVIIITDFGYSSNQEH